MYLPNQEILTCKWLTGETLFILYSVGTVAYLEKLGYV